MNSTLDTMHYDFSKLYSHASSCADAVIAYFLSKFDAESACIAIDTDDHQCRCYVAMSYGGCDEITCSLHSNSIILSSCINGSDDNPSFHSRIPFDYATDIVANSPLQFNAGIYAISFEKFISWTIATSIDKLKIHWCEALFNAMLNAVSENNASKVVLDGIAIDIFTMAIELDMLCTHA